MSKLLKVGDVIHCQGIIATIGEIIYQEPFEWRDAYYIEFRDINGNYRNWKQNFDGGYAEIKEELVITPELIEAIVRAEDLLIECGERNNQITIDLRNAGIKLEQIMLSKEGK